MLFAAFANSLAFVVLHRMDLAGFEVVFGAGLGKISSFMWSTGASLL
jgi:hypothetical protein